MDPKWCQNGARMVPECRQNGPKGVPRTSLNVRAVLAPVLPPKVAPRGLKRVPNGAPNEPKEGHFEASLLPSERARASWDPKVPAEAKSEPYGT